ncbi:hypothetical protein [Longimicrobium sp.]|jgi:uncharacterized protein (DUF1684 family)|uniref:hypothetical protein n=1 Tax=Longimicrobium sp. TaxID=2029185 RepID=UPI002F925482
MIRGAASFLAIALLSACGNPFNATGPEAGGRWRATLGGVPYDSIHLDLQQTGTRLTGTAALFHDDSPETLAVEGTWDFGHVRIFALGLEADVVAPKEMTGTLFMGRATAQPVAFRRR